MLLFKKYIGRGQVSYNKNLFPFNVFIALRNIEYKKPNLFCFIPGCRKMTTITYDRFAIFSYQKIIDGFTAIKGFKKIFKIHTKYLVITKVKHFIECLVTQLIKKLTRSG